MKSPSTFNIPLLAALSAVILLALSGIAEAANGPRGRYCGKLKSGGEVVDVETILQVGPDGRLYGDYQFRDQGSVATGKLQEARATNLLTKQLFWVDKYGSGSFIGIFAPDFESFEGYWGQKVMEPGNFWTGKRCLSASS